jgi:hypothetical protein
MEGFHQTLFEIVSNQLFDTKCKQMQTDLRTQQRADSLVHRHGPRSVVMAIRVQNAEHQSKIVLASVLAPCRPHLQNQSSTFLLSFMICLNLKNPAFASPSPP